MGLQSTGSTTESHERHTGTDAAVKSNDFQGVDVLSREEIAAIKRRSRRRRNRGGNGASYGWSMVAVTILMAFFIISGLSKRSNEARQLAAEQRAQQAERGIEEAQQEIAQVQQAHDAAEQQAYDNEQARQRQELINRRNRLITLANQQNMQDNSSIPTALWGAFPDRRPPMSITDWYNLSPAQRDELIPAERYRCSVCGAVAYNSLIEPRLDWNGGCFGNWTTPHHWILQ